MFGRGLGCCGCLPIGLVLLVVAVLGLVGGALDLVLGLLGGIAGGTVGTLPSDLGIAPTATPRLY